MAVYQFQHQIVNATPNKNTLFHAMLVDSNGIPVTGQTFIAGDVKLIQYIDPDGWTVSNIQTLPVEIANTGCYLFTLLYIELPSVMNDELPVGIRVEQVNGASIYGFFSINFNPVNADARYLYGGALNGNNASLNLHTLNINSYVEPNDSPGYYEDAVVIKGKVGIKIDGDGGNPGLLINNKTISELVAEAAVDGATSLAEAISEILSYASCTTERDVETGTITYKNRNGETIFTLTPRIDGRIRSAGIPNIMHYVMRHHFNNPS